MRRQSFQRRKNVLKDDVQIHIGADDHDDIEILQLYQQVNHRESVVTGFGQFLPIVYHFLKIT
jgi:hypothetical protein